jgi:hypothetical protein
MPGFGVARMIGSVRFICDADTRNAADTTLGAAITQLGRSRRRLDEALEASALCIDLRRRQAAATTTYFEKTRRF